MSDQNIKWGQILTPKQAAKQLQDAAIPTNERYRVYARESGGWSVWNHETGDWETHPDGREVFEHEEDAETLAARLAG